VRHFAIAWILMLALAGCNLRGADAVPGEAPATDLAATRQSLTPIGEMLLVRINHDRDVLSLPALTPSQALDQVAGLRAEDMLARGYLGPTGPGDVSVPAQDLMTVAGYVGRLGELTYGHTGPLDSLVDATVGAWIASDAHRALLLDSRYHFIGVGMIGEGERWIVVLALAERGP
jgi:uncharacterized protein YkwD